MIVIDVGNTNIVIGIYLKKKLNKVFRLNTIKDQKRFKSEFNNFLLSQKKIIFNSNNKLCILSLSNVTLKITNSSFFFLFEAFVI